MLNSKILSILDLRYLGIDIYVIVSLVFCIKFLLSKKIDSRDYNLQYLKQAEYDEFEVEGDNNVPEMISNNPTGPSTEKGTFSSTIKTPKRVRLTI